MAFLGLKKKTKKEKEVSAKPVVKASKVSSTDHFSWGPRILKNPRVTEKGAMLSEKFNVYSFDVDVNATKKSIAFAVKDAYKVSPIKVTVLKVQPKKIFSRGKYGMRNLGKKAYVYLKKGDKIEFV